MTTVLVAGALLLFASIYLGLGWSLVAFQFPGALATTRAENFAERFQKPVARAVGFFAVVSVLMVIGSAWLTTLEWARAPAATCRWSTAPSWSSPPPSRSC